MQYKITFVAFVATLASTLVAAAPSGLATRAADADGHLFVCTDANFQGECLNLGFTQGTCQNMPPAFQDDISSWGPDAGFVCTTYTDINCSGLTYEGSNPGFSSRPPGINDAISSFACFHA